MSERIQPLPLDQILVDRRTGQAWKVAVIEAISSSSPKAKYWMSQATDGQIYLYGCSALDYDDERVIFPQEIGKDFIPIEYMSSTVGLEQG